MYSQGPGMSDRLLLETMAQMSPGPLSVLDPRLMFPWMLAHACGLIHGVAAILNHHPVVEIASTTAKRA